MVCLDAGSSPAHDICAHATRGYVGSRLRAVAQGCPEPFAPSEIPGGAGQCDCQALRGESDYWGKREDCVDRGALLTEEVAMSPV